MCPSLASQCLLFPPSAHHGHLPSQAKYDALKKQMESMEMEVMEARLIRAAELNGELDDDDSGTVLPPVLAAGTPCSVPLSLCHPHSPLVTAFPHTGGEWRLKYERAVREIDFTKKRLQQELEDKLEVEQQGKRQLERKVSGSSALGTPWSPQHGWDSRGGIPEPSLPAHLCLQLADLQADSEESQRALQQLKKKCQRLAAELQDTKLHLEGQQGRNHDLEKKQRRWGPCAGSGGDMGDTPLAKWHYHFSRDLGTSPAPIWLRCLQPGWGCLSWMCLLWGGSPCPFGGPELSDPMWGRAPWWRLLVPCISAQCTLPSHPLSQPQSLLTLLSSRDAFISLW